ncbi:glycoside hydrolase family 3 C-terminal domain-containing protein [Sphingomonas sp. HITSZ_GF]|uniref:beta-glucosidase H n=1 Tax=Sphingomonas sp. HITSZ_GF TaxID=3037247 RepID=UPI00240E327D|nr:glycoside hydrolase family 3 C-terminal domain-containing protein [Sphingomonas sp. HITSZ_GF]MDG2532132.1 glycoside hydrolase family 3 C-terminal domain-containing protein [Sphingomonas sp. HITSZ_GF]
MAKPHILACVALAALIASTPTLAQAQTDRMTYREKNAPLEKRVEDLMGRLTLEEKVSLLAGESSMTLQSIPRLGIPGIKVTDGPTGVRSPEGKPATVFPVGVAIAATWNPEVAKSVGAAIAEETRGYGAAVLLAPTVNIVRTPRWGRNFETYSEDPLLAGKLGLGYVAGVQGKGIGVSIKHFAANNHETNRFFVDSVVDERTLREIYLPAFETVVKQADPWSVMASYNKVNGTYASENRWLLTDLLKQEWGYKGFVVSDWGATHSTAPAVNAGLDLEMPGPAQKFGEKLLAAVRAGEVTPAQLDDNARRIVRLIVRSGALDGALPKGEIGGAAHRAAARAAADEAIVLLKNSGVLPLKPGIKTLAVIGPNAAIARIQGGGSSAVTPFDKLVTPLEAIRAALPGVEVIYEKGVDSEETPPTADPALFSPAADSRETGLEATYFANPDFSGDPVKTQRATDFTKRISANIASAKVIGYAAMRWSGVFRAPATGTYEFSVRGTGTGVLTLDGKTILDKATPSAPDNRDVIGFPVPQRTVQVQLEGGKAYPIRLDYVTGQTPYEALKFGVRTPRPDFDAAVAAAKRTDAAIVIGGSASLTEGEGYDRANFDLPGEQDRLIAAVAAANPATVVVVNAGAAMTMPWEKQVPAILDMWLPGQEGAAALADILIGKVNPSGKLPVTFPAKSSDDQTVLTDMKAKYSEGLLVGYRGYEARGVAPLFAFGHGLSYTSFGYAGLTAPASIAPGAKARVKLSVRNTGKMGGKDVVQLYVARADRTADEPVKQLAGFSKVALAPGETRTVEIALDPRAFGYWDTATHHWVARAGAYQLLVGSASDDIRLKADIRVTATKAID